MSDGPVRCRVAPARSGGTAAHQTLSAPPVVASFGSGTPMAHIAPHRR